MGQKGHGGIRGVQGDTSDLKEGDNMKFNVEGAFSTERSQVSKV